MGLVFVAVSINRERILSFPGLPGRAGESILQFLQVFLISSVALVPRQPSVALALEVLVIALISWLAQVVGLVRYARVMRGHPKSWIVYRTIFGQLATLPFFIASVMIWIGSPAALYWLVPGFLFSFIAAVGSAWVLLVEIMR